VHAIPMLGNSTIRSCGPTSSHLASAGGGVTASPAGTVEPSRRWAVPLPTINTALLLSSA